MADHAHGAGHDPPVGPAQTILNLHDFEPLARERMAPGDFAYYAGGAHDEITLRDNIAAFERHRLRPRVLVDVSQIDTATSLLGTPVALPFGIAPTAVHALAHPDGECATARAAAAAGVVFCASTMSSRRLEEIAQASGGARWFQLYTQDNEGPLTEALVRRAEAAGYSAIVLTADVPVGGRRERELRAGFDLETPPRGNVVAAIGATEEPGRPRWALLHWLRGLTPLPVVLKGVLTAEDAALAVGHGAAAVWVSNHGGRQLDRAPATIDVLEEIVAAVAGRAEVYLDGGVRRGADVATALALGASAVFLGRPILFALAANGEPGVREALDLLAAELRYVMAHLGATNVAAITRTCVV